MVNVPRKGWADQHFTKLGGEMADPAARGVQAHALLLEAEEADRARHRRSIIHIIVTVIVLAVLGVGGYGGWLWWEAQSQEPMTPTMAAQDTIPSPQSSGTRLDAPPPAPAGGSSAVYAPAAHVEEIVAPTVVPTGVAATPDPREAERRTARLNSLQNGVRIISGRKPSVWPLSPTSWLDSMGRLRYNALAAMRWKKK